MRKIFTIVLLLLAITVSAQDIIITKDSQRIEAKILEISPTQIKYKKYTNLEGPTFIANLSDISSILYANGELQTFATPDTIPQSITTQWQASNQPTPKPKPQTTRPRQEYPSQLPPLTIYKTQGGYRTSQNKFISNESAPYFFETNSPEAYNLFQKSESTITAGWCLLIGGVTLDILSIITFYSTPSPEVAGVYLKASTALAVVGGLMEISCIPTLIVGYNQRRRVVDVFNQTSRYQFQNTSPVALSFGISSQLTPGIILTF